MDTTQTPPNTIHTLLPQFRLILLGAHCLPLHVLGCDVCQGPGGGILRWRPHFCCLVTAQITKQQLIKMDTGFRDNMSHFMSVTASFDLCDLTELTSRRSYLITKPLLTYNPSNLVKLQLPIACFVTHFQPFILFRHLFLLTL